ncbi:MAG: choice-of-anchor B family protein [Calditrichia bacterium]
MRFRQLALLVTFCSSILLAQISQNVSLLNSNSIAPRHSGSWGYVDASGNEYALIGGGDGLYAFEMSTFTQVGFVAGPSSNWREITVVGDYAYVTSEGFSGTPGLQIVNLGNLPAGITLETTYTTGFSTAHIIQADIYTDSPYIYVMGAGANPGARVLDVSNPVSPVEVANYDPYYIHDAHIREDRMYAAALGNGLDIIDISDKTNPVFLAKITHPQDFTHSSWTLKDNKHIIVTDEVDGLTARIWNIEDLSNISLVAEYSANLQSLVHNPYVRDDFVFISHNTEGFRVLDVADPALPIEVGFYDTWSGSSGGFNGLWSAYPYFPSGRVIGGDRTEGFVVFNFNNTKAARVYGTVIDSISGDPIAGAQVLVTPGSRQFSTDFNGEFQFGDLPSGESSIDIEVSATGYTTRIIDGIALQGGDSLAIDIKLVDPTLVGISDDNVQAQRFTLTQNYPNPFNPATEIRYYLPRSERVQLTVFDLLGRQIASLVDATQPAGWHISRWDGLDNYGNEVTSGVYLYRLETNLERDHKKMILMR